MTRMKIERLTAYNSLVIANRMVKSGVRTKNPHQDSFFSSKVLCLKAAVDS